METFERILGIGLISQIEVLPITTPEIFFVIHWANGQTATFNWALLCESDKPTKIEGLFLRLYGKCFALIKTGESVRFERLRDGQDA